MFHYSWQIKAIKMSKSGILIINLAAVVLALQTLCVLSVFGLISSQKVEIKFSFPQFNNNKKRFIVH